MAKIAPINQASPSATFGQMKLKKVDEALPKETKDIPTKIFHSLMNKTDYGKNPLPRQHLARPIEGNLANIAQSVNSMLNGEGVFTIGYVDKRQYYEYQPKNISPKAVERRGLYGRIKGFFRR